MKHLKNIQALFRTLVLMSSMLMVSVIAGAQGTELSDLLKRAQKLGIEESQLQEIRNRAQQQGLNNQEIAQLIEPAVSLADQNLPSEAVFSKALEGLSKGVPANRITAVLQNIRSATREAAPVVESWMARGEVQDMIAGKEEIPRPEFRNEMIKSVSRGFMENIPSEVMNKLLDDVADPSILAKTDPQSIAAAVRIFPDLPAASENPGRARSFLVRSLKSGFVSSDLQKLPGAMSVAQQRSQLPAAKVLEGVSNQLQSGIPAKQILQNLFNGNIGGGPPGSLPKGLDNIPGRGDNGR